MDNPLGNADMSAAVYCVLLRSAPRCHCEECRKARRGNRLVNSEMSPLCTRHHLVLPTRSGEYLLSERSLQKNQGGLNNSVSCVARPQRGTPYRLRKRDLYGRKVHKGHCRERSFNCY